MTKFRKQVIGNNEISSEQKNTILRFTNKKIICFFYFFISSSNRKDSISFKIEKSLKFDSLIKINNSIKSYLQTSILFNYDRSHQSTCFLKKRLLAFHTGNKRTNKTFPYSSFLSFVDWELLFCHF